ncbi:MAG: SDR family NAD(P)-dependent oxidoreductase [Thermodesulfobacteriota bacterium]|nr:SDR family NAD(P)-dependent oxidoreductase [Thermodesulfobacteriota bacterium]
MDEGIRGKVALVTGSGKKTGIGYAVAQALGAYGANLIIADMGEPGKGALSTGAWDEMEAIARDLGDRFSIKTLALRLDVTSNDSILAMEKEIEKVFGHVDILVNNAGASFGVPNTVLNYDEDAWMKTIDVNLHGVFRVSRGILPLMAEKGGSIINTASRAGKRPAAFNGAYSVAKAGVIMLTKVMASELAGMNIRVNAICPGQIMTDLEKWRFSLEAEVFGSTIEEREQEMCKTIPLGRIGLPAEVGRLVRFLASNESSYLTGQAINITGGQLMEI